MQKKILTIFIKGNPMQKPEITLENMPSEKIQRLPKDEIQNLMEEERQYNNSRPQKRFYFAVEGAKTKNGGSVKASSEIKIGQLKVAVVGDEVIYPDGTISLIKNGCSEAGLYDGKSLAIVGSCLENGDEIIETLQDGGCIRLFDDEPLPKGFLV